MKRPGTRVFAAAAMLAGSSFYLLAGLGHYDFWCDEADTALFAQGILRSGDMTAVVGHNLYAYRNGSLLTNLHNRYTPPLPYYVTAASMSLLGENTLAGRLPFALCGLATVALIVAWLWRDGADGATWWLITAGLLGNASFFLFARQCRYYALATLATVAIVYVYVHARGRWRDAAWLAVLSLVLMATQYLNYAALYAALALDYLALHRRGRPLTGCQVTAVAATQAAAAAVLAAIWNPLGKTGFSSLPGHNPIVDKLQILWWSFRDLNACEFGVGLLMLAAPVAWWRSGNSWLLRGALAVVVYVVAATICSPQAPPPITVVADVRYLVPLIPLCIYVTAMSLRGLVSRKGLLTALALLAFGTNVLHHPLHPGSWRSTPLLLAVEILERRTTSVMMAADWVRRNVAEGQSVVVLPDVQAYPLMFQAPQAVYAWQLYEAAGQFQHVPRIHVQWRRPPDWIVAFGPDALEHARAIVEHFGPLGVTYRPVEILPVHHADAIRPELFWRSFTPLDASRPQDRVLIFGRESRAAAPG